MDILRWTAYLESFYRQTITYLTQTKTEPTTPVTMTLPLKFEDVKAVIAQSYGTLRIPSFKQEDVDMLRKVLGYTGEAPKIEYRLR